MYECLLKFQFSILPQYKFIVNNFLMKLREPILARCSRCLSCSDVCLVFHGKPTNTFLMLMTEHKYFLWFKLIASTFQINIINIIHLNVLWNCFRCSPNWISLSLYHIKIWNKCILPKLYTVLSAPPDSYINPAILSIS